MIAPGRPYPLGVVAEAGGVNVAVASARAEAVFFCLFDAAGEEELARLPLPGRTGEVFHGFIPGVAPGARYGLRASGPWSPRAGHRFNVQKLLLDPFALAIDRPFRLAPELFDPPDAEAPSVADSAGVLPKAVLLPPAPPLPAAAPFDWSGAVLYELHVRGFTARHPQVPAALRGTFAGLAHPAALDWLSHLGVSAVELMPSAAWIDERHLAAAGLSNYWGYNPVAFCAPDPRLAPGGWEEIAATVATLHARGIAVLLDVVLNHTGEGDAFGPTLSLRGLDQALYYRLRPDDPSRCVDDTGCGNTLAFDRLPVIALAMAALRAWAGRAGVDGFRFDLATTLARRADGFDPAAPLLTAIAQDPLLGGLALIVEPWDVGPGGWRLGAFPAAWGEWNDRYRDGVRRFWRGDRGTLGEMATRLAGSADTFIPPRQLSRSINFVTAHDGFTLADLVAYTGKHNEANGEGNRDGTDNNLSWNNGAEGPTDDPAITAARSKDVRALLATLLFSRGTPMLAMGDDAGRTQRGNNNAYAQDNPLSWFDWEQADTALAAFTARLIAARRARAALRYPLALSGKPVDDGGVADVVWLDAEAVPLTAEAWNDPARQTLVAALYAPASEKEAADRVLVVLHAGRQPALLRLPPAREGFAWRFVLDSAAPETAERAVNSATLPLAPRSVLLLCEEPRPRPLRPDPSSLLQRLAAGAGIATAWWDIAGIRHVPGNDTLRALLASLRLPADTATAARESLARLAEEQTAALPPSLLAEAGEPVELRLGPDCGAGPVRLLLADAQGDERTIAIAADQGVMEPQHGVDGRLFATRRVLLPPLPAGRYRLRLADRDASSHLLVAPPRCFLPPALAAGRRAWGVAAQVYTLRRAQDDQGIGDLGCLAALAHAAAAAGAAVVGINPLHALFPTDRNRASPYYPSDRRFLDPLLIDVTAPPIPLRHPAVAAALAAAWPLLARLAELPLIDYPAVWRAKLPVLEAAFAAIGAEPECARFVAAGGTALRDFARFDALAEAAPEPDWHRWPAALHDPAGPTVAKVAAPQRVAFHAFLQWVADRQLATAAGQGLAIGLYRDLAVGAAPDGAEAWAAGGDLLSGVTVGAPPDPLGPEGQNWGLPPPDPRALRSSGFAALAELLAANMRHAGALRIDHVMGLARLFLVPAGGHPRDGTYLAYPFAEQLGHVALASRQHRCLVVGEDLGTVPDFVRAGLVRRGVLSYQVLRFAREGGHLRPPGRLPPLAVACAATHDIATVAGWWQGADIDERVALGQLDATAAAQERQRRSAEKAELIALLQREGLALTRAADTAPLGEDLLEAVHALLVRTPCLLVLAQADDLAGETVAVNLPGTDRERPNWRRRLRLDLAALGNRFPACFRSLDGATFR